MKKKLISLLVLFSPSLIFAANNNSHQNEILVIPETKHDISPPLRDIPALSPEEIASRTYKTIRTHHTPLIKADNKSFIKLTEQLSTKNLSIPVQGFQGIGVGLGSYHVRSAPPDTNGSVGLTQYVQWVNTDFAVFNKSNGQVVSGFPKRGNALWDGFGGLCETTNEGDPIVKYDQLANRWVFTQFAFADSNTGPFFQCVAVSTTSDATGTYNRYAFQFDSFNDYAKLGLWPDAYYMTFNMFGPISNGPRACALDRSKMLLGQAATMQCSQLSFGTSGTLLPADLDGQTLPPNGNPEYFLTFIPSNLLRLYKFHVDFNNSSNTTFTGPVNISVANFTIACPNTGGDDCAKQPQTTNKLDTLSDRLMHRLAYRKFANRASMVATHTIRGGNGLAAIRWYELRFADGSTTPTLFQQGSRGSSKASLYMGSIAMDKVGNIAVGFSVSSPGIFPSISIGGRLVNDPLNTFSFGQRLKTGSGSQINNLSRWGDYTAMSMDPVDDCTFWYTNEYLKSTGSFNWSTYISNFKLANCV